ncbi:hypothetical protein ARAM_004250, partial [Aspergillus rambellii]
MSTIRIFSYILLYTSLFPICSHADATISVISDPLHNSSDDVDLTTFLNLKAHKHDEIFTEAIQLLESLKSSPSCNRIAASKLVTSCQSIGRKPDTPFESTTFLALETVRSLYAARLAICEIDGAGISIPPPCLPVNISPTTSKGIFRFSAKYKPKTGDTDPIPRELLQPCLRALESRPQWWTSYSNSRQNAVIICQASRAENEREDLLNLHKSIVESSIKLDNGLHEALQMAAEESARQKAFMQATTLLRTDMLREMEESASGLRNTFIKAAEEAGNRFGSIIDRMVSALGSLQFDVTVLEKGIKNSSREASQLQQTLQFIQDEAQSRNEKIAFAQHQNAMTHNELVLSLESKLQSILQDDMARFARNLGSFDASLHRYYNKKTRLRSFGSSLEGFQQRFDNLNKVQQQQYETTEAQSRLQENLHMSMRISQAILDQTAATAANLQTVIDEAAAKYQATTVLSGLFRPYLTCITYGLLVTLIGLQNPRIAVVLFLICI